MLIVSYVCMFSIHSCRTFWDLCLSLQGCWAQNTQSTILSFLHNSSLIADEVRANFNRVLAQWLAPGTPPTLKYVNLVGLNNVCDYGTQLLPILRARLPGEDDERPWLHV